ncbi:MAG: restriction endonuclease [Mesorhizobium sp.]|uniref:5-methylcytosine restriction system specificity protein McrC n=1 Tax=Mesorhizobium sp. TaxID=1871066 RepID=UPI000FE6017F|nr:restriction endonuclease [Mesorhizobium sp.]RWQ29605.1 MAG: restriction endonuclease [Mesorhizobium sp.]
MAVNLAALGEAVGGRGFAIAGRLARQPIAAVEQDTILLPPELVRTDGSLDVYDDVLKLFRPTYHKNRPAIQCSGWVGYIPLNDSFALEVSTRVPVGNLERLVAMAVGYTPDILRKYTRQFAHAVDRPASLLDMLTDQLLDAFDHVWESGLMKTYDRVQRAGSAPVGRIMPFQSEWLSAKSGRPVAVSSAFHRTPDFGPNRVLRHAFEKLLSRYIGIKEDTQRARTLRLRQAVNRLAGVGRPLLSEVTPGAIAGFVRRLPSQHEHYADALMVAQLLIFDMGLSIRGTGGVAILPSILIDMAKVFENYVRRVLADGLRDDERIEVKDGNKGGEGGAKLVLFDPITDGLKNPGVTPDIVIDVEGKTKMVIDAKYKPAPRVPERDDVNQVVLYGARYGADRVMLLHAGRQAERQPTELCGHVGGFQVYNGMVDLNAEPIETEEANFVEAVRLLL